MTDQPTTPEPRTTASSTPRITPITPALSSDASTTAWPTRSWAACRLAWPLRRSGHYPRRLLAQLIDSLILLVLALVVWAGTPYSPVHRQQGEATLIPFPEVPLLNNLKCSWGPIDTTAAAAAADSAAFASPVTLLRRRLANGTEITWSVVPQRRWAVALLFLLAYHTLLVGWRGQTAGKWMMGLRVVGKGGGRIGYLRALGRAVAYLPGAYLYLGVFWILIDRGCRGWHDLGAGTRIVDT